MKIRTITFPYATNSGAIGRYWLFCVKREKRILIDILGKKCYKNA
ncbi:MAG: hypothetical protein BWX91_00025 [Spirochaetes bacterium ADurb.Bin133]|jgi:hypothetical protein|nr:MAG: hypothetical protein BWX91_00025 [Spirochaetes bacterium ADurb.Bin133]